MHLFLLQKNTNCRKVQLDIKIHFSFNENNFQNCKFLERMDLEECNQITDSTLAHLATGCPSLEKLVSCIFDTILKRLNVPNLWLCFKDLVPLRAHHRRWHSSASRWQLRRRKPFRVGAGQLSADHRSNARASRVVSQFAAHRTVRLPDDYAGCDSTSSSKL